MIHPLTFLKGAGLGAGMMYFFDPVQGDQRRATVKDKFESTCTACEQQLGLSQNENHESDQAWSSQNWSSTTKMAAMLGGLGLAASLLRKRDIAALGIGIVGLTYLAKELAEQKELSVKTPQRTLEHASTKKQLNGKNAGAGV